MSCLALRRRIILYFPFKGRGPKLSVCTSRDGRQRVGQWVGRPDRPLFERVRVSDYALSSKSDSDHLNEAGVLHRSYLLEMQKIVVCI
eukprot:2032183-Pleurochrysis_carterae.AAC.6